MVLADGTPPPRRSWPVLHEGDVVPPRGTDMRNWRTMVGALCIVMAMLLGAFAGITYARDAGVVSASSDSGTRGEDRQLVSAADQGQTPLSEEQAKAVAAADDTPTTDAFATPGSAEVTSTAGAVAQG